MKNVRVFSLKRMCGSLDFAEGKPIVMEKDKVLRIFRNAIGHDVSRSSRLLLDGISIAFNWGFSESEAELKLYRPGCSAMLQ